jgi:hypothetical protein
MNCTTHFYACSCREHKLAVLAKALDAAFLLDNLKEIGLDAEQIEAAQQVIERCYAAVEELGFEIGGENLDHTRGCVCSECMPAFAKVASHYCEERN